MQGSTRCCSLGPVTLTTRAERVNSLRDELEREHREGNQDAEPDDDHAHRCETSHSSCSSA